MIEERLGREIHGLVPWAARDGAVGFARLGRLALELDLGSMAHIDGSALVAICARQAARVAGPGEQLVQRDLVAGLQGGLAVLQIEQPIGIGEERGCQGARLGRTVGLRAGRPGGQHEAGGGERRDPSPERDQKVRQQSSHRQTRWR